MNRSRCRSSSWSIVHKLQWIEDSCSARARYVSRQQVVFKDAGDQIVTRADETITLPVVSQNNIRTEIGESHALATPIMFVIVPELQLQQCRLCFPADKERVLSSVMVDAFAASVERPWERAVTSNNVPFYIKYVYAHTAFSSYAICVHEIDRLLTRI